MSSHAEHHDHHITPPSLLIRNFLTLGALMGLTIAAAKVDVGHLLPVSSAMGSFLNNVIALLIACIKTYCVVSIFMGVKWSSKLVKMWALTGFVWLPLLLGVFGDYLSRRWEPVETWNKPSEAHGRFVDEPAFPSEIEEGKPKPTAPASSEH
jgi:caa(3)-type oxidase subunit IV